MFFYNHKQNTVHGTMYNILHRFYEVDKHQCMMVKWKEYEAKRSRVVIALFVMLEGTKAVFFHIYAITSSTVSRMLIVTAGMSSLRRSGTYVMLLLSPRLFWTIATQYLFDLWGQVRQVRPSVIGTKLKYVKKKICKFQFLFSLDFRF